MVVEQYVDKEMSNVGLEVTKVVEKVVQVVTRNSGFDIYDHIGPLGGRYLSKWHFQ